MQALKPQVASKPVSIKLDANLKSRVDALAVEKNRSPHWLMQDAIANYVAQEERLIALQKEAMASYEDYERTGLHLDSKTAKVWMKQLIAGEDAEIPEWQR